METQQDTDLSNLEGGAQLLECHTLEEELGVKASYIQNKDELARWRVRLHRHLFKYLERPLAVKLHESSSRSPDNELIFPPDVMTGVVFTVRCPLDVVPSFSNHFTLSLEQSVAALGQEEGWTHHPSSGQSTDKLAHAVGSWSSHARSWLDEPEHRCLTVRYEDLLEDTLAQLKRIVDFSGQPWDEAQGAKAVELCRFEKMKAKEAESGFKEKLRKAPVFFNKGQSGRWREALSPELCLQVCRDHHEMMRRLGYGAEVDEVFGAHTHLRH